MKTAACFEASTFQRLLAGALPQNEVDAFAAHLKGCEHCVQTIRGLSELSLNGVVQRLPTLNTESPSLRALIEKVLQLRSSAGTLDRATLDTHTLERRVPAPATDVAGPFVGRYRIIRELGRGGMGTVYEAEDPQLRRRVALKVPQFSGSADNQAEMRQRFLREARAAGAVDHPNVCRIHDVGEHDGKPFVVMAFIEGPNLADRLAKLRRVNDRAAVGLTMRIAEGLLAVHALGIIHRDLKPANILLPKDSNPILTDFGLAHIHADAEQITGEGAILGTPAYMAPEQAVTDLGPVTTRTDLYSLGVILFQMLTGRLPLEGNTMQILAFHGQRKQAPPPSRFRPDLDPKLDAIVRKAMAYRPEERYADVRAFAKELKDWLRMPVAQLAGAAAVLPMALAIEPPTVLVPPPLPAPASVTMPMMDSPAVPQMMAQPRRGRKGSLVAVALFLLVAGGVALAIIIIRNDKGKETPIVAAEKDKPKERPNPEESPVLIDEDFQKASDRRPPIPTGWESKADAFAIVKDKAGRACLRVNKVTEHHYINVPLRLPLNDNFSIAGEFALYGPPVGVWSHKLTILLESLKAKAKARVRLEIDSYGAVTFGNNPTRISPSYQKWKINRFCLEREGKTLRVQINDEKNVAVMTFDEAFEYDKMSIGLTAGEAGSGWDYFASLYSLKVETKGK